MTFPVAISAVFFLLGGLLSFRAKRRQSADVLEDLLAAQVLVSKQGKSSSQCGTTVNIRQFLRQVSINDPASFSEVRKEAAIGVAVAAISTLITGAGVASVFYCFTGFCSGYLLGQYRHRSRQKYAIEQIEKMIPMVMERLVMAVQSGLDVAAGLQVLIRIERQNEAGRNIDIVTELLELVMQLTESGVGFNQALREVAAAVPCTALKHSFVHLAVAHEEGGELVIPLRELSDSTQLYYQELVEERIAKLPVKATMPLVCTFAGLIIFFITTPLLQVMELLSDVSLQ